MHECLGSGHSVDLVYNLAIFVVLGLVVEEPSDEVLDVWVLALEHLVIPQFIVMFSTFLITASLISVLEIFHLLLEV